MGWARLWEDILEMDIFDHSLAKEIVNKLTLESDQDPHIWLHRLTMMTSSGEFSFPFKMLTMKVLQEKAMQQPMLPLCKSQIVFPILFSECKLEVLNFKWGC